MTVIPAFLAIDANAPRLSPPTRHARALRLTAACGALVLLSACGGKPLDFDLRGLTDGFSTADAAIAATEARPDPDSRGVISYPTYQVAVAQRGDTIDTVANRIGMNASELAAYNGIPMGTGLRAGEVIALPRTAANTQVAAGTIASGAITSGPIDVVTLANEGISASETGASAQPTVTPAPTPSASAGQAEPIRHQVQRGETAYSIARLYDVSVRALADWNGLGSDLAVTEGRYLLIPVKQGSVATPAPANAGAMAASAPAPAPTAPAATTAPGAGTPTPTPPSAAAPLPSTTPAPASTQTATATPDLGATRSTSAEMAAPVPGAIIRDYDASSSSFILFSAPAGTTVKAAKDGTVKLISKNADGVQIMVVDHGGGLQTAYSFIDGITVAKGASVKRGQSIAKVTANEFNALQFMVFKGTSTVDPTPYLQ
ncbi:Murein hydrolase activator NlpD precursor [Aquimixticola soesokkakensis]|uniref:Murein hydrolase activator NlpD n=1 Tax=Aquimixticola soesokkakensis TaxID=1519096 RepID=A0A1Y5S0Q3_9RHOB|nr:LysM peptidoglycan-binding domain-containing M23 family metallopeptidase [Aquimixticola soesokkakensis]SLN30040.1 Murein hydrolase activator NlpD precursor [Aquimixticola soesokkakensis]